MYVHPSIRLTTLLSSPPHHDNDQGVTLVVKDVAGAVIQATAHGGKVIQDVQTLEYPATQVRSVSASVRTEGW